MRAKHCLWRRPLAAGAFVMALGSGLVLLTLTSENSRADWHLFGRGCQGCCNGGAYLEGDGEPLANVGTWYWMRSPEQEKEFVASIFNRYCIRCHGVDGRGVWDIPGVPNFTNTRWQASRSDGQIARIILEGRGAVMPPFRGTLALEEAWAMARYLRTFVPGSEASRPDFNQPATPAGTRPAPTQKIPIMPRK